MGFVFRDETDKLALAAERRRRRSLTTPTASRNRQPLHPDRPQQRSPRSDNYEEKKKNEEPTTGGDGTEHQQATWRDRPGGFTFHTLEALEASKKKGGRVKLKWRKDPL